MMGDRDQIPNDPRSPPSKKACLLSQNSRRARAMAFMEGDPESGVCPELLQAKQIFGDRMLNKPVPAPSPNARATLSQIKQIFSDGEYFDCNRSGISHYY